MVSYEEYEIQHDNMRGKKRRKRFYENYECYETLILVTGATENLRNHPREYQNDKLRWPTECFRELDEWTKRETWNE